jgi:hypothetical protein
MSCRERTVSKEPIQGCGSQKNSFAHAICGQDRAETTKNIEGWDASANPDPSNDPKVSLTFRATKATKDTRDNTWLVE